VAKGKARGEVRDGIEQTAKLIESDHIPPNKKGCRLIDSLLNFESYL
jgi:hypothetical protein